MERILAEWRQPSPEVIDLQPETDSSDDESVMTSYPAPPSGLVAPATVAPIPARFQTPGSAVGASPGSWAAGFAAPAEEKTFGASGSTTAAGPVSPPSSNRGRGGRFQPRNVRHGGDIDRFLQANESSIRRVCHVASYNMPKKNGTVFHSNKDRDAMFNLTDVTIGRPGSRSKAPRP